MTETRKTSLLKAINILLTCVIILLIATLVTLVFFVSPITVTGGSMEKTFHEGDRLFIQKSFYSLNYGDIVVFKRTLDDGKNKNIIKRIIGMSGDTITFKNDAYYCNGEKIDEPYLDGLVYSEKYFDDSEVSAALTGDGLVIGENEFFVLGDNRNISYDSHKYGCITKKQIKGKVIK